MTLSTRMTRNAEVGREGIRARYAGSSTKVTIGPSSMTRSSGSGVLLAAAIRKSSGLRVATSPSRLAMNGPPSGSSPSSRACRLSKLSEVPDTGR
jgi:hypothetical protein